MAQKTENTLEAPRKPLLFADSMYASERRDGSEFRNATVDSSYVPWYSEERSRNELRASRGEEVTPLPHLVWVRVKRVDGQNVSHGDTQLTNYRLLGFRAMGMDDLQSLQKALGADALEMPPTAHVDQNGLIVREDTALFFVDAERAKENRRRLDEENLLMQSGGETTGPVQRDHAVEQQFKGSLEQISKIELPD